MNESSVETFGLSQIGQIAVPVSDIERAIQFYRDTLGMRFLFQAPPGLGFFDVSGVRLMLDGPAKAQAGNSSVIYYRVSDLQAVFATVETRHSIRSRAACDSENAGPRAVDGLSAIRTKTLLR